MVGPGSSFFSCPLCGKLSLVETYDPTAMDNDVVLSSVRGLGRGRGFESVDKRSAFQDSDQQELLGGIASRSLEIARMFLDQGVLNISDLSTQLGLQDEQSATLAEVEEKIDNILRSLRIDPDDFLTLNGKLETIFAGVAAWMSED